MPAALKAAGVGNLAERYRPAPANFATVAAGRHHWGGLRGKGETAAARGWQPTVWACVAALTEMQTMKWADAYKASLDA